MLDYSWILPNAIFQSLSLSKLYEMIKSASRRLYCVHLRCLIWRDKKLLGDVMQSRHHYFLTPPCGMIASGFFVVKNRLLSKTFSPADLRFWLFLRLFPSARWSYPERWSLVLLKSESSRAAWIHNVAAVILVCSRRQHAFLPCMDIDGGHKQS